MEMKSCPFCGGKSQCRVNFLNQWSVGCLKCRAMVWGDSRDDAIKNWDRRVENG